MLACLRNSKEPSVSGSEKLKTDVGGDAREGEQSQRIEAFAGHGKGFWSYSTWQQATSALSREGT